MDKRIARGDDFAGDAWVRYTAVGHKPEDDDINALAGCNGFDAAAAIRAYPRLVKALRECCELIEAFEIDAAERSGSHDDMPEPARDSAELLLSELGEDV